MADGRCFTINTASQLFNDKVMDDYGISYADNYAYRKFLQTKGPEAIESMIARQRVANPNGPPFCNMCNEPLFKVPNTY
jgi:hypothetical protein